MNDSWEDRRKAKEEEFFKKQNETAMKRIKDRTSSQERLSPVTGKPMIQQTVMGVVIDRCPDSGGVWLDAGELEALIKAANDAEDEDQEGWTTRFFKRLFEKKD